MTAAKAPQKLPVRLRVFDVKADIEIRCMDFNYNSRHHRKRISKTTFWALSSGHAVELVKVADDEQTN